MFLCFVDMAAEEYNAFFYTLVSTVSRRITRGHEPISISHKFIGFEPCLHSSESNLHALSFWYLQTPFLAENIASAFNVFRPPVQGSSSPNYSVSLRCSCQIISGQNIVNIQYLGCWSPWRTALNVDEHFNFNRVHNYRPTVLSLMALWN